MELEPPGSTCPRRSANALTLMRERANRNFVTLSADVDGQRRRDHADERKFKADPAEPASNA